MAPRRVDPRREQGHAWPRYGPEQGLASPSAASVYRSGLDEWEERPLQLLVVAAPLEVTMAFMRACQAEAGRSSSILNVARYRFKIAVDPQL